VLKKEGLFSTRQQHIVRLDEKSFPVDCLIHLRW